MAKSLFTTIEEGMFEVIHRGEKVELPLPEWLKEVHTIMEDEEALIAWAKKHGHVLGVFHSAMQGKLIDLRAVARPVVKYAKDEREFSRLQATLTGYTFDRKDFSYSLSILEDNEILDRLEKHVWKAVTRPGTGTSKKIDQELYAASIRTAVAMLDSGVDKSVIRTVLGKNHDSVTVAKIMNEIEA